MLDKLYKIKSSPYSFPVTVMFFHSVTYYSYFFILNSRTIEFIQGSSPYIPFWVILPGINYPNFLGLFLVFQFLMKRFNRIIIVMYIFCISLDHFSMFFYIMDNPEREMPKIFHFTYFFRISSIKAISNDNIYVCIFVVIIHLLIIKGRSCYGNLGKKL